MGKDRTKENLQMLDSIDFLPFFEKAPMKVGDLKSKIEDYYAGTDFVKNDVMEGWVFNWINTSELCDYLKERYPDFCWYEVTEEYCYIDKDD